MAILSDLPGLSVGIAVDDDILLEYSNTDDEEIAERTATVYIEVPSGAEFSVVATADQSRFQYAADHIQFRLHLDGRFVARIVHDSYTRWQGDSLFLSHVVSSTEDGWVRRNFSFAELDIHKPILTDDRVAEKNLKGSAVSHQAKLTAPQPCASGPDRREIIDIDDGKPFATFNFKYRSRNALRALGLIPRSPSPVPLEERPVEQLTPEELRELIKRQKERLEHEAFLKSIKKEYKRERSDSDDEDDDDGIEATDYRPAKAAKLEQRNDKEVVDLCGED